MFILHCSNFVINCIRIIIMIHHKTFFHRRILLLIKINCIKAKQKKLFVDFPAAFLCIIGLIYAEKWWDFSPFSWILFVQLCAIKILHSRLKKFQVMLKPIPNGPWTEKPWKANDKYFPFLPNERFYLPLFENLIHSTECWLIFPNKPALSSLHCASSPLSTQDRNGIKCI